MDGIRHTIRELNEGPLAREGLFLTQVYDETDYIESAIGLVRSNIIVGGTLAVMVLFIFLRSVSSVAIIATAHPDLNRRHLFGHVAFGAQHQRH